MAPIRRSKLKAVEYEYRALSAMRRVPCITLANYFARFWMPRPMAIED